MADPKEMKFDRRILDRNLRSGAVGKTEYESYMKSLKDVEDNVEVIDFGPLATESESEPESTPATSPALSPANPLESASESFATSESGASGESSASSGSSANSEPTASGESSASSEPGANSEGEPTV